MKYGVHAGLWLARWTDEIAPVLRTAACPGFDGVEVPLLGVTEEKAAALAGPIRDLGPELT
jgi:D-psicose/D-tagatose/L-ribulose 3-epimerase